MRPLPAALRKPIVVVVALALAALVGAAVVNAASRRIHRADSAAIVAFQRDAMPHVDRVVEARNSLVAIVHSGRVLRRPLASIRSQLESARRVLHETHIAKILQPSAAELLTGMGFTFRALATAEESAQRGQTRLDTSELARFDADSARSQSHLLRGLEIFSDLLCRARLPECAAGN